MGKIILISDCKDVSSVAQKLIIIKKVTYKGRLLSNNQTIYVTEDDIENFKNDYKINFEIQNYDLLNDSLKQLADDFLNNLNITISLDGENKQIKKTGVSYSLIDNIKCSTKKILVRINTDKDYIINKENFLNSVICSMESPILRIKHNLQSRTFRFKDYCKTKSDDFTIEAQLILENMEDLSDSTLKKLSKEALSLHLLDEDSVVKSVERPITDINNKVLISLNKTVKLNRNYYNFALKSGDKVIEVTQYSIFSEEEFILNYIGKYYNVDNGEEITNGITNKSNIKIKFKVNKNYDLEELGNVRATLVSIKENSNDEVIEGIKDINTLEDIDFIIYMNPDNKKRFKLYLQFNGCSFSSKIEDYIEYREPEETINVSNINITMLCQQ